MDDPVSLVHVIRWRWVLGGDLCSHSPAEEESYVIPEFLIPESKFPLIIIGLRLYDRSEVYRKVIEKPKGLKLLEIPPLAKINKIPIIIRIEFGDGTAREQMPITNENSAIYS